MLPNNFYEHKNVEIGYEASCGGKVVFYNRSDTGIFKRFVWLWPGGDSTVNDLTKEPLLTGFNRQFSPTQNHFVILKAIAPWGYVSLTSDTVRLWPFYTQPKAAFTTADTAGCQWVAVQFTDSCTTAGYDSSLSYRMEWQWGDGQSDIQIWPDTKAFYGRNRQVWHSYTQSGTFTARLIFFNGYCTDTFTQSKQISIRKAAKPGILTADTGHCLPHTIQVLDTFANLKHSSYQWGDGADTLFLTSPPAPLQRRGEHTYADSGSYWVRQTLTSSTGCVTKDSLLLQLFQTPKVNLGNDTFLCDGEVIVIPVNAGISDSVMAGLTSHLWNTGDTSATLSVSKPGLYWLQSTNGLCVVTDSIIIQDAGGLCNLSIYLVPNPANEQAELRGYSRHRQSLTLQAVDMAGKTLFETKPTNIEGQYSLKINTASWAVGMYLLHIQMAGEEKPRVWKMTVVR